MGTGLRLSATAVAAFLTLGLGQGTTLSTVPAEAAGKLTAEQARKTILSGIKAYERGDAKKSVSSLSYALNSGGLSSTDMAKALYYRGRAYRKQGRHAQAISDLTSAIWLKNGLSESEKKNALAERASAYKTAGVAAPTTPVVAKAATPKQPPPAVAAKAPAPVIPKSTAATQKSIATDIVKPAPVRIAQADTTKQSATAAGQPVAKKPAPKAYVPPQPSSGDFTVGIPLEYQSTRKNLDNAPAGQARASGETNSAPSASDGSNSNSNPFEAVGTFFTDLFSGSSSDPTPAPAANFSGSQSQLVPSAGPQAAVSGWSSATTGIATGSTKKRAVPAARTQVAALVQKPISRTVPAKKVPAKKYVPAAAKASKSSGKYGLQVAVLKSRGEAETLVAKLMQKHGTKFGNRVPSIDEQVFGNMGKYYRVKVGSYANTGEPKSLCSKIAKDGYDCFVVQK